MIIKNLYIEIVATKSDDDAAALKLTGGIATSLEKYFSRVEISLLESISDLQGVVDKQPDLIFVALKTLPNYAGDQLSVSDYLENAGVNYTGSGSIAMECERDKTKAKEMLISAGLNTSAYFIARKDQYQTGLDLPIAFPLFIKPYDLGDGSGIDDKSVVRNFAEYLNKVKHLTNEGVVDMLVEKYVSGREFTVAVMRDSETNDLMVMPIEQIPEKNAMGDGVIGHAMKSALKETATGPVEQGRIRDSVMELARATFNAVGARDYGRVDMRLDDNDTPQFLEINLIPSLVEASGNFTKAFGLNTDETYDQLLLRIVNLALERADTFAGKRSPTDIALDPVVVAG